MPIKLIMPAKQPLSYQILPNSCWPTCVMNALTIFEKNKAVNGIGFAEGMLRAVLKDDGVQSGWDWWYVLEAIAKRAGLKISGSEAHEDVAGLLRNLNFKNAVAICEVNRGGHSILLTDRDESGWLAGFDPSWDNIIEARKDIEKGMFSPKFELFPTVRQEEYGAVNIRVEQAYFLKERPQEGKYQIGPVSTRNITIIENIS